MNEEQLQKLVEEISIKYFNIPFIHQVRINRRLKTTGGRYNLQDHHIDINAHFLTQKYHNDLVGIIKHELVHYHLHLHGLGYKHQDRDFKQLLKQVGGSRYAPDIGLRNKQKVNYIYQCQNCKLKYYRVRKVNTRRYRCGKCGGKLAIYKNISTN